MTVEERIGKALDRSKRHRLDPAIAVTEVYLDELLRILQQAFGPALVWKGGTVLRLMGNPRYSRDLDATLNPTHSTEGPSEIRKALSQAVQSLPFLKRSEISLDRKGAGLGAELSFRIPGMKLPLKIGVEISTRERLLLPAEPISTARISHALGTRPVLVLRLADSELLAEKLRALLMRRAPRDIVDLYFCLQNGMRFDAKLFREKMKIYSGAKTFDLQESFQQASVFMKKLRPERLRLQLANYLPEEAEKLDFAVILEDVRARLDEWGRACAS